MRSEYSAYATDFYINQRLNLKMDLSMRRDTVLSFFDRVRRDIPEMDRFKRYTDELALESRPAADTGASASHGIGSGGGSGGASGAQQWVAVRKTSIRSGSVNPDSSEAGYRLHRLALESAPYYLDISPLDIDHLEVLYGFDMMASGNHDGIVFNALHSGSPLASLVDGLQTKSEHNLRLVDCQPLIGLSLSDDSELQAHFEVKTRSGNRQGRGGGDFREDPISVYLIVRKYGPFEKVKDLETVFDQLTAKGEELLDSVVLPRLLGPIRDAIVTGG
jgi:hypothetical protein